MPQKLFQPSFYRHAQKLKDSEPVRMLHILAREIYRDSVGEAIEHHIAAYEAIVARWQRSVEGDTEGQHAGQREGMRAMTAVERGYERKRHLRESAYLQARVDVYRLTGARIELPLTPEEADRMRKYAERAGRNRIPTQEENRAEEKRILDSRNTEHVAVMGWQAAAAGEAHSLEALPPAAKAPEIPAGEAPALRPTHLTGKLIKAGLRKLIDAKVNREKCESLKDEAKSGKLTRQEFSAKVQELLHSAA